MVSELQQASPTAQQLAEFRANPVNWTRFGSYSCAADPRLMVRDRLELGWTLNMAHPRANVVMGLIVMATLGVVLLLGLYVARTT
jgi:uncharacterized membrane protein